MAQTYDKYTRGANPVRYFIEKGLEYPISGHRETKLEVFDHYLRFCTEFGLAPESEQSFSRKLKAEGFSIKRRRVKGDLVYFWEGVKLRDWQKKEKEEEDKIENYSFSDTEKQEMK